jgi:hypothetical protein
LQQKNKTKTESKNKDAPRKIHSIWSNKNIVSWKMPWYFCWWRRGAMGHPQALTLVLLGYFLGWHGHIQAWAFVHPTLENFLHTKLHTILIRNISLCKIANPLWFECPYLAVGRWDRSQRSVSDRNLLTGKGNQHLTKNRSPRELMRDREVVGWWWAFDAGWWAEIPFSWPSRVRNKFHLCSEIRTICYKNYSLYSFIVCRRRKKTIFLYYSLFGTTIF